MDISSIIVEVWKIRRIGGLSCKENLVALFSDGTHICTCMETVTKGIVCRHFWRVMLYSSNARFHISLIPARWYKDEILMKLDVALENSPIIKAIESSSEATTVPLTVDFTLQTLQHLQGLFHNKENVQRIIPQRNRFGIAFSTAKTAINIALETRSNNELVKLLKDFILTKQRGRNGSDSENNVDMENSEHNENDDVIPLQQQLIDQTTDPHVTRIRGAPCKKRIKSAIEMSGKNRAIREITSQVNVQETDDGGATSRSQRKCLLCGKPGHYQKKCPGKSSIREEN
jgi:hypothetical protein